MSTETRWRSCCCTCTSTSVHTSPPAGWTSTCSSVSHTVTFYHTVDFLGSFRVMKSPHCQMNQNNLARVFGPTVVGHGMSEPSPTTIMRDTNTQLKVSVFLERRFLEKMVNSTNNLDKFLVKMSLLIFSFSFPLIVCRWSRLTKIIK